MVWRGKGDLQRARPPSPRQVFMASGSGGAKSGLEWRLASGEGGLVAALPLRVSFVRPTASKEGFER